MTDQRKDEMPELRSCSAMVTTMRDNPYPCNFPAKRLINGKYLCGTHSRTIKKLCAESPPVPDDVTVSREVLQGVRDALEQLMDDLSGGSMKYPNVGVCEAAWIQAELALASLDAVLSEGKS